MANPTFSFFDFSAFRTLILSLGGSSDVSSGAAVPGDIDISGRYARTYSADLPDAPGRTISFFCGAREPGTYGTTGYIPVVILTGCPWGTAAERDETYRQLALAGCSPNDMHLDRELLAMVESARASVAPKAVG